MLYAFLILLAVALLGAIVLLSLWKSTEVKLKDAQAALAGAQTASTAAEKGTEISEAARADEKARLEAEVAQLKSEIAKLEGEIDANPNPDAVRQRLRGMLGDQGQPVPPAPTSGGSGTPYGGVSK